MIYTYIFFPDVTRQVTKQQAIDFFADWLKTVRLTPEMFRRETGDVVTRRPDFYRFIYDPQIDKCVMEFGVGEEIFQDVKRYFFFGVNADDEELFRVRIDDDQIALTEKQIETIIKVFSEQVFNFEAGEKWYPLNNPAYFCIFETFASKSVYVVWDNGVAVGQCSAEKLDEYVQRASGKRTKK